MLGDHVLVGPHAHVNGAFPPGAHDELWKVQEAMDFPGTVFGLSREEASVERVCSRYSETFGRHRGDRLLD